METVKCWCGDEHEPPACPTCDTCGAPVTTGMMVIICPRRMRCEFYDHDFDEDTKKFLFRSWLEQDSSDSASVDEPASTV